MYAIIDIETTGGNTQNDKITEIAVFLHDGERIVEEYSTLINPERKIPYHITGLTGITNEMVAEAPRFYEVAKEIVEITKDATFVAHNVGFDYGFVRSEFKKLGFDYSRKTLCTVKLSRKLLPGKKSYSLGKLCKNLGIELENRHRAAGDARATVTLFERLLSESRKQQEMAKEPLPLFESQQLTNHLSELTDKLPEDPGVYYFHNDAGDIIYIGKSKNVRRRVLTHLYNNKTKRAVEMKNNISDISYECTGSDLLAMLLEADEIKKHQPIYNRAQRKTSFRYGIFHEKDEKGYLNFKVSRNDGEQVPLTTFSSLENARNFLFYMIEKYQLCQKLCGLYKTKSSCFHYTLKQCHGACIGKEETESYNERAEKLVDEFAYKYEHFLIIEQGRHIDEMAVVLIENGTYQGFGFVDTDQAGQSPELLKECVKNFRDTKDIQQILRGYLKKNKAKIIELKKQEF